MGEFRVDQKDQALENKNFMCSMSPFLESKMWEHQRSSAADLEWGQAIEETRTFEPWQPEKDTRS